jgi:hypothetical protein
MFVSFWWTDGNILNMSGKYVGILFGFKRARSDIKMSTSILEQEYIEPCRPYSQRELQFNRERLFRTLRVGKVRAHHKRCDHFYLVKENGRKQEEIKKKSENIGNCSVCWKFNKTPRHLKSKARSLINAYCNTFCEPLDFLSYENADLENVFYKWLYEEHI